jgi:dCMP deaminase
VYSKSILTRIKQAEVLAGSSSCPRGKVGALIFNPENSNIVADGYNGGPRKAIGSLCGGDMCVRDSCEVKSGTEIQIGCHHAEMNALCNALRQGTSTLGMHMIVTTAPCLMCAKLVHHSGINKVYYKNIYSTSEGIAYLEANRISCEAILEVT